ncbi:terminase large subunit domain-containing protein [Sphingopyxis flava]|uniref:Terminase large (ATPase) subunit and inactivated derivatives n=1 Tax=Sphingopyxis flava TaxID=1507287 RepID=A0A1T5AC06_9SPHN|nr:terminase family protein [Sphingopyxis flava]SKB32488.1 terminase large (ATPase) subunit and inactivated derivatives [Sphingopyxis flava]
MSRVEDALAELGNGLRAIEGFDPAVFDIDRLISELPEDTVRRLVAPVMAAMEWERTHKFDLLFPDEGEYRRELYPRHLEFFRAGATHRQRCFMAANRVGKTVAGSYEVCAHLTGAYPHWWEGRTFRTPTDIWAAGDTNETTRDIIQKELLGQIDYTSGAKRFDGTGMIPRDRIGRITWKQGVQDLVDTVLVKHRSGKWSRLSLKSYDQGRRVFQGTAKHVIWLDEECPLGVYEECLYRTVTTNGLVMLTFTPLLGLSETVMQFMPSDMRPGG